MKIKKIILLALFIIPLFMQLSCRMDVGDPSSGNNTNNEEQNNPEYIPEGATIPKKYWGTWTRMDTGSDYYIDGNSVYEGNGSYKYKIQDGINGYTLESDSILKNDIYRYFKKSGKNRDFKLKIAGFDNPRAAVGRGPSLGIQHITGKRENQNNSSDTQTIKPNADGTLDFSGAISGDDQKITIESDDHSIKQEVTIKPSFDGENMGTVPIVPEGDFGFKITYGLYDSYYDNNDSTNFYACSPTPYDVSLNVKNIGYRKSEMATVEIKNSNPYLKILNTPETLISEIDPGLSENIKLELSYAKPTEFFGDNEYEDCTLDIIITEQPIDSKAEKKVWKDSVTFRFYKGSTPLIFNTHSLRGGGNVNGFIIYPNGKAFNFNTSNRDSTVHIPWSKGEYTIVFSGAASDETTAYSFGFESETWLEDFTDKDNQFYLDLRSSYEDNNTEKNAYVIKDLSKPVVSYLSSGDVDIYKVSNKDVKISQLVSGDYYIDFKPIDDKTSLSDFNNGDGKLNPGEVFNIPFDLVCDCAPGLYFSNMQATISCDSPYIKILENSKIINCGNTISHTVEGLKFQNLSVVENAPTGEIELKIKITNDNKLEKIISKKLQIGYYDISDLKLSLDETGYAKLNWTNPTYSSFDGVEILYGIKDQPLSNKVNVSKEVSSYTINGLNTNFDYELCVISKSLNGKKSVGVTIYVLFNAKLTETPIKIGSEIIMNKSYDIVKFGDWPQSRFKGDVNSLKPCAFINAWDNCYMDDNGHFYIKVEAEPEEPYYTFLDGTPIEMNKEYYFKIEPIKWRVLTDNYNGKKLLLANNSLATCPYFDYGNPENANRDCDGKYIWANNYKWSEIRAFLNGYNFINKLDQNDSKHLDKGFLQKAFSPKARDRISETTIDNSAESTSDAKKNLPIENKFACEDTLDKIFLLSEKDVTTRDYGFEDYNKTDRARSSKLTDYTIAVGGEYSWRLRSPDDDTWWYTRVVSEYGNGKANFGNATWDSSSSIVPALSISF